MAKSPCWQPLKGPPEYLLGAKLGKDTRWWRYHKDGRSPRQDCEQVRRSQVQISLPARFFTSKYPLIYLHKLLAFIHVRPPKIIQVLAREKESISRVGTSTWGLIGSYCKGHRLTHFFDLLRGLHCLNPGLYTNDIRLVTLNRRQLNTHIQILEGWYFCLDLIRQQK